MLMISITMITYTRRMALHEHDVNTFLAFKYENNVMAPSDMTSITRPPAAAAADPVQPIYIF